MASKLFEEHKPKFLHTRNFDEIKHTQYVAVYEEYEKQINSSVTLTCIVESNPKQTKIILKKTGGRMGFRGSSLSEERSMDSLVNNFIFDFGKRYGLTVQEERVSDAIGDE
jgi:hypothetical protein